MRQCRAVQPAEVTLTFCQAFSLSSIQAPAAPARQAQRADGSEGHLVQRCIRDALGPGSAGVRMDRLSASHPNCKRRFDKTLLAVGQGAGLAEAGKGAPDIRVLLGKIIGCAGHGYRHDSVLTLNSRRSAD